MNKKGNLGFEGFTAIITIYGFTYLIIAFILWDITWWSLLSSLVQRIIIVLAISIWLILENL